MSDLTWFNMFVFLCDIIHVRFSLSGLVYILKWIANCVLSMAIQVVLTSQFYTLNKKQKCVVWSYVHIFKTLHKSNRVILAIIQWDSRGQLTSLNIHISRFEFEFDSSFSRVCKCNIRNMNNQFDIFSDGVYNILLTFVEDVTDKFLNLKDSWHKV